MGKFIDLTGQRFGRLAVLSRAEDRVNKQGKPIVMWHCKCDCGNECNVEGYSLRSGKTVSCGCYGREQRLKANTKHGLSHSRLKRIYNNMHSRCDNPNTPKFENHGGRGISVCDEWSGDDGFINFYTWAINNGYSDDLSIDRIDNDGNYSPDNCHWTDYEGQQINRRNTLFIEINGVSKQTRDWAKENNLTVNTIWGRWYRGDRGEDLIRPSKRQKEELHNE